MSTESALRRGGIMSHKENLKTFYSQDAERRNSSPKQGWKIQVRDDFYSILSQENKQTLLELGAGAGYDSQFFMEKGLQVVAIDLSPEMVSKCREKSIEAHELDFYDLSPLGRKFDCIWAMNTLLHVPKADLPHVLRQIDSVLKPGGLFFMGVYGGFDSEREYVLKEVSEAPRFFASYTMANLLAVLEKHFQIISSKEIESQEAKRNDIFQSIIMKKES